MPEQSATPTPPGGYPAVLDWLQAGGPVLAVLVGLSVIALAITFLKLWQFAAVRISARRFAEQALSHWRAGRCETALTVLDPSRNPIARVLSTAMRGQAQGAQEDRVREEAARVANAELENLRGHLRGLELIGSLSPLLGLLGTVLGMIAAFQQLAAAGHRVDPSLLSAGIWEALLTTAVGLAVAIPTVTVLHGLERAIERLQHGMEDALTRVFTGAPAGPPPVEAPSAWPASEHA